MIFKPYYPFETGCAGYLFGCGDLGQCAVDALSDVPPKPKGMEQVLRANRGRQEAST
jgi:hypothetical protein